MKNRAPAPLRLVSILAATALLGLAPPARAANPFVDAGDLPAAQQQPAAAGSTTQPDGTVVRPDGSIVAGTGPQGPQDRAGGLRYPYPEMSAAPATTLNPDLGDDIGAALASTRSAPQPNLRNVAIFGESEPAGAGGQKPASSAPREAGSRFGHSNRASALGSPIYILEQSDTRGSIDEPLRLWQLHPSETPQTRGLPASRLLFRGVGAGVRSYAVTGFQVTDNAIIPGSLLMLDGRGRLRRALLGEAVGYRSPDPETLPGHYALLEQGAESSVLAVTTDGRLMLIGSKGQPAPVPASAQVDLGAGEDFLQITRDPAGAVVLLTSKGRILMMNQNGIWEERGRAGPVGEDIAADTRLHVTAEALWMIQGQTLTRVGQGESGATMNRVDLRNLAMDGHLLQDGERFEFLGSSDEEVFVRVGPRAYRFWAQTFGEHLSYRLIDTEFFGKGLRSYGIPAGTGITTSALQPREAVRGAANMTWVASAAAAAPAPAARPATPAKAKDCAEQLTADVAPDRYIDPYDNSYPDGKL